MNSKPASVPVFRLYGEYAAWPTPDLIHCESIAARSMLHGWEIKPHRHSDMVQLLYIQAGDATVSVEGRVRQIDSPALQIVPALSVHAFKFSEDVRGFVLSLAQPLVQFLAKSMNTSVLETGACLMFGDGHHHIDALFSVIVEEYISDLTGRDQMLQSLITVLAIWLDRHAPYTAKVSSLPRQRGRKHLQAFTHLLESRFCEHRPIAYYATALGISAAYLNAICRRMSGQSALQIINQRLLLEAKRNLIYTSMTINQVSDSLGFSEPAYFSRFFKKAMSQSPKEFRAKLRACP